MHRPHVLAAVALAAAATTLPARAVDMPITTDGAWHSFLVDSLSAPVATPLGWIADSGALLDFTFTLAAAARLTVVDAGFAGDVFAVTNFGAAFGATNAVPAGSFDSAHDVGTDFAAALADPAFSRGVFNLGAGSYRISGVLTQSVTFDGVPLDATVGAVRLEPLAAAVPEPSSIAILLAGLCATGAIVRRRSSRRV